jgi:hypothetical protein
MPRMRLYNKRLFSTWTIAVGIALSSVVQICYHNFHSEQEYPSSYSRGIQLLTEFTTLDISYDKRNSSIRELRRMTVETNSTRPFHQQSAIQIDGKEPEIKLLLSPEEIQWIKQRGELFDLWYNETALTIRHNSYPTLTKPVSLPTSTSYVVNGRNQPIPADFIVSTTTTDSTEALPERNPLTAIYSVERENEPTYVDMKGPWLDFVIVGNP